MCDEAVAADCEIKGRAARNAGYANVDVRALRDALGTACSRGRHIACGEQAMLLLRGPREIRDAPQATALFRRSCLAGIDDACINWLASLVYARADLTDAALAIARNTPLCERSSDACNNLGKALAEGIGAKRDFVAAADFFRRACEAGNMTGCSNLAHAYRAGEGVDQSDQRALELNAHACNGGSLAACNNLGDAYEHGRAVPMDIARARELYERACKPKYAFGCVSLGELYAAGHGVSQDWAAARRFFRMACDWDEARGCVRLAALLQTDQGGPRDPSRAQELLRRACRDGYAQACGK